MTQEEKLLVDRYLENSLTGIELKDFIDRLDNDEKFRKEVSFQNLLMEGIQYSEYLRHVSLIKESISYKKSKIPFALKLIFTFLFITTSGIVLWNYIDPGSTGKKHNYFSLDFIRKTNKDSIGVHAENNSLKNKKPVQKSEITLPDTSSDAAGEVSENKRFQNSDTTEIVVRKDQLLITVTMKVINLNGKDPGENTEVSISKSAADKLNPAGGLPESNNEKSEFYIVEFWLSPVNYKGYKFVNDKLVLFGIEEPDAIQLYTTGNKLWMKYGQDYFEIEQTDDFEALIKKSDIPSALK